MREPDFKAEVSLAIIKNSFCIQSRTKSFLSRGLFIYYVRTYGWVDGSENGNFPLLYVLKMSLRRGVSGSKKAPKHLYVIDKCSLV